MRSLALPLRIENGRFASHEDTKKAIDENISMIISTPVLSSPTDPSLGFVFTNLRFEQVDENEGVVMTDSEFFDKKISGNSRNLDTFAFELRNSIVRAERRLSNIKVSTTYIIEERALHITVGGIIKASGEEYSFHTTFAIWNRNNKETR